MAAAPVEEDLNYLWKPKKTMRDWGQTNYNIVRNWSLHETDKTPQPSHSKSSIKSLSKPSTLKQSLTKSSRKTARQPSATKSSCKKSSVVYNSPTEGTGSQDMFQSETSSYRLRRSTKRQTIDSTWYVPGAYTANEQGPSNLKDLYRRRYSSVTGGAYNDPTDCGSEQSDNNVHSLNNVHSPSVSSPESPSSLLSLSCRRVSKESARILLSPSTEELEHAVEESISDSGEMERESEKEMEIDSVVLSSDKECVDYGESDVLPAAGVVEDEPQSVADQMNTDCDYRESLPGTSAGLATQEAVSKSKSTKKVTRTKKLRVARKSRESTTRARKQKKESSINVKLWQPKYLKRSPGDLNELDICLTIYDRVIREAVAGADDEVVQRALVSHWKGTQKHIMSVIKDLHTVQALEKRLKKEQAQHSHLQKEMLTVLSTLRRSNGEYQEALSKAKQEKQRRQAQSVEAQIAAVGLQLQANHTHPLAHDTQTKL